MLHRVSVVVLVLFFMTATAAVEQTRNPCLVVFGRKNVVVIDAKTAKEIARIASLQQPVQVLFAQ